MDPTQKVHVAQKDRFKKLSRALRELCEDLDPNDPATRLAYISVGVAIAVLVVFNH